MKGYCGLRIDPEWAQVNKAARWCIETTTRKTLIRRRVVYRASAYGYEADGERCALLGVYGGSTSVVEASTADEAVDLMRDYICRQRKAHEDWQRSRDIRRFNADEVCP